MYLDLQSTRKLFPIQYHFLSSFSISSTERLTHKSDCAYRQEFLHRCFLAVTALYVLYFQCQVCQHIFTCVASAKAGLVVGPVCPSDHPSATL